MKILIIILCIIILFILHFWYQIEFYTVMPMNDTIKLKYIREFLTDDDCDYIIGLAEGNFAASKVVIGTDKDIVADDRTSHTYFIHKGHNDRIKAIEQKICSYLSENIGNKDWYPLLEDLQVVKYEVGQEFKQHHDWFQKEYLNKFGEKQRQYTMFVYLNDVQNGGETIFPRLNEKVKPAKGNALFWENCTDVNNCHNDNLHQGTPPTAGIKYGLNVWVKFD
jgi:prolyl 4-hydroxylase